MKATGMVRKVDSLGRIALPMELRRTMDINVKDPLEISVDGSNIILNKYASGCVFCGDTAEVTEFKGELVCPKCMEELKNI